MPACPTPVQLRQLLDEALEPEEFRTIEAHLEKCQPCRTVLDGLAATLGSGWPASFLRARQPRPQAAHFAGHFQPRRFHARGGLGEVYEVHDEQFHRPVALKVLQARHSADPESRQRFLREAEITAQLEHPGIVPVYNFAEVEDGRPGYAMRFVQGETFREAIQRFHEPGSPPQDEGERRLALRALLNQFIAACNPVAFAHSRGFLHRDLKPANIMLGPFGETLVLDWGLAKGFGGDGDANAEETTAPGPERMAETNGTLVSQVSGTPGFMSPEQAAGPGAVVGPATDIYSLGATLYDLLTGQAPFPAPRCQEELQTILTRIQTGNFSPPRAVKAEIPPALEAICLKAMARRPEDRYPTVLALAADLERWLAAEPVSARPERWWERGLRWLKRHRVLATAGGVAILVALASFAAATVLLNGAYDKEQEARKSTEKQRTLAVQFYDKSVKAAYDFYRAKGTDRFADHPEFRASRDKFRSEGRRYFQELIDESPDDEEFHQPKAVAYLGLGLILKFENDWGAAEANFRKSLALLEPLAARFPQSAAHQERLAECYESLACILKETGRLKQALRYGDQAHALRAAVASDPDNAASQEALASVLGVRGNLLHLLGHSDEAEAAYHDALEIWARLIHARPGEEEALKRRQAEVYLKRGELFRESGRPDQALKDLEQTRNYWRDWSRTYPQSVNGRGNLAIVLHNLSTIQSALGRQPEAEAALQEALTLFRQIIQDNPGYDEVRFCLAGTLNQSSLVLQGKSRRDEAQAVLLEALDTCQSLVEKYPDRCLYRHRLGQILINLGYLAFGIGQPEAALEWYTRATDVLDKLLQDDVDYFYFRDALGAAHGGRAIALHQLNCHAKALPDWDQALRFIGESERGRVRLLRASSLVRSGDWEKGFAEAEALAGDPKFPPQLFYDLACVFSLGAKAVGDDGRAERYAVQAMTHLTKAHGAGFFQNAGNLEFIKKDADFDPLRARADFQKFLADLEKTKGTKPPPVNPPAVPAIRK